MNNLLNSTLLVYLDSFPVDLTQILYIKTHFFFVCLFVCPELIEELAGATDLKFGKCVEDAVTRNKTKVLSDISTDFWEWW